MRRPAFLAGQWYPDSERACRQAVEAHGRDAKPEPGAYRGLIGPHAGFIYSGDAAGRAYRWLAAAQQQVDLVVVFGSHRGPHGPNTVFRGEAWETPLGDLVNHQALAEVAARELHLSDEPAEPPHHDNGVELHLPFVRHFFPTAKLLMIGPAASPEAIDIGTRVGALARTHSKQAVFVGSTDLTHYGPNYDFEPQGRGEAAVQWARQVNDRAFIDAILSGEARRVIEHGVAAHSACCPGSAAACMAAVRAYGGTVQPRLIDHYLSYDVQPHHSFVGYAGILL